MTVRKAYDALRQLIKNGHGDLELYGIHGASGVSYEVSIHSDVMEVDESDDAGPLCEMERGTKYAFVYLGN
jgi:hypothetical protein